MTSTAEKALYDALYPPFSADMTENLERSGEIYEKILSYIEKTKIRYRQRLEYLCIYITNRHYSYHFQRTNVRIEVALARIEWLKDKYDDDEQLVSELIKVVKFED
jgi:hypothetical protein